MEKILKNFKENISCDDLIFIELAELSFAFWDNEIDPVYDKL